MVIMSRSQDKLQKVANEISELVVSLYPPHSITPSLLHSPPLFVSITLSHTLILPHSSFGPYPFLSLASSPTHLPEEKHNREVRIIPVDFSDGQELYPRIAEELQDLDIGVLGTCTIFCLATVSPAVRLDSHCMLSVCYCSEQCRIQSGAPRLLC